MSVPTLYEHYTNGGVSAGLSAAQPHFTLNGKNVTLYSGAMHYFRVPPGHWRDRLRKMRAAGLNTVETYVPWNLHEPEPGVYDFGNGGSDFQELLDIEKFLKIAQEEDLFAIVRPGPYICSEWEFGGLPSWLLRDKGIQVRTSDEIFMKHVARYFNILLPILALLQFTKGGPIIAFQIENEYGSLRRNDMPYLEGLKNMFLNNGITELLFTSDGPSIGNYGQIPGVLYTGNFNGNPENELNIMQSYQPGNASMVMEYWSGWFDHWTEQHHTVANDYFTDIMRRILKFPASINFYMFHGGTSFGFMNGANIGDGSTDNKGYQPDTNNYDYDGPLTENGDYTDKYFSIQKTIDELNDVKTKLPEMPEEFPRKAYKSIEIEGQIKLDEIFSQINETHQSTNVIPMELLAINNNSGQSYGYIVYRKTNINLTKNSMLKIEGRICDTLMVLINGVLVSPSLQSVKDLDGFGYWRLKDSTLLLNEDEETNVVLDLVVENWGRNNFGNLAQFVQHKGLWQGDVLINDVPIRDWQIIPLEFKKNFLNRLENWHAVDGRNGPSLYKATLEVNDLRHDTFIDMSNWKKGFVAVNGFVLSRHCHLGPQQTAYLPAPFLKMGKNELIIFEHFEAPQQINFSDKIIYHN